MTNARIKQNRPTATSKRYTKQAETINYILDTKEGSLYYSFAENTLQVIVYTQDNKDYAIFFYNASSKYDHYYYTSSREMANAIHSKIERAEARLESKKEAKAKKQVITAEVGDVFNTSWGYEQTNVEFYQVIERNGKTGVVIQEIAHESVKETSWCSDEVKPVKNAFIGEPMTKRLGVYGIKINDVARASRTDWNATHHRSWGY